MALSAADLQYIRQSSGDSVADTNGAYEVSDVTIQAIYDDVNRGDSDLDATIYYVLRRRLGLAVNLVNESGELSNAQKQQKFENIMKLLTLWGGITGLTVETRGALSVGTIGLNLDYTLGDLEAGL